MQTTLTIEKQLYMVHKFVYCNFPCAWGKGSGLPGCGPSELTVYG